MYKNLGPVSSSSIWSTREFFWASIRSCFIDFCVLFYFKRGNLCGKYIGDSQIISSNLTVILIIVLQMLLVYEYCFR